MPLRKLRKQRAEPASIARYRYAVYNRAEIAEILETQSAIAAIARWINDSTMQRSR